MLRVSVAALLMVCSYSFAIAEPLSDPGKVTAVTVYQGQALVTREVELAEIVGLAEVVVTDLPAQVTPGSLYAEPIGDVEIRSVRYRVRPVAADTRQEVRELDQQIQEIKDKLAAMQSRQSLLKSQSAYLQKLENFTTKTASHELTSGVLDATTLKDLTKTIFEGRAEVAQGNLEIQRATRDLNQQLTLLNQKRQGITSSSSKSIREAVVFLNAPEAGAKLRLTYLVTGATWSPSYNLRASGQRDQVMVEYNASVQQQSGEDWTDVKMTLSTASPSLVATAPKLLPLPIELAAMAEPVNAAAQRQSYARTRSQLAQQQKKLSLGRRSFVGSQGVTDGREEASRVVTMDGVLNSSGGAFFGSEFVNRGSGRGGFGAATANFGTSVASSDIGLNYYCNQIEILDWNNDKAPSSGSQARSRRDEGISVVYELANRTSLPSRADQQLIPIASLPLEGDFYRVARPVLTEYVYEEARVVNDTDFVLLAGPAATFLADRFVGRGLVPTVAVGEPFTIGLGIDESLRATRELVDKDRRVQGGNRVVRSEYRLMIENFGNQAASVRLYDRLPSAEGEQIKVSLLDATPPPADGDVKQRKEGILQWLVEAPAKDQTTGKVLVDYAMLLEYDRNRSLVEVKK